MAGPIDERDTNRSQFDCYYAGWKACEEHSPCVPPPGYDEGEGRKFREGYEACCAHKAMVEATLEEIHNL